MASRLLPLVTVLLAVLVLIGAVGEADLAQRIVRNDAVDEYTAMSVPNVEGISDPEVFWPTLRDAAEKNSVNVFRKVSGWTRDDRPFSAYYVYLTAVGESTFFESFDLQDLFPILDLAKGESWAIGTLAAHAPVPLSGEIGDIAENDECYIASMDLLFDKYPIAGTYYIEAASNESLGDFVVDLENTLSRYDEGTELVLSDDMEAMTGYDAGETSQGIVPLMVAVVAALLVSLVIYCQMANARKMVVFSLYGIGFARRWWEVVGRRLCVSSVVFTIAGAMVVLFVPGSTMVLLAEVALSLSFVFLLVIVASIIGCHLVEPRRLDAALKGRCNVRGMAAICLAAKVVLGVVLIYWGAMAFMWQEALDNQEARYAGWAQTADFGIFYPRSIGFDGSDDASLDAALVFDLYPKAVEDGALYVDAMQFIPELASMPTAGYRTMVVNPNYLEIFPVRDSEGGELHISEDDSDRILLVPESYREEEQAIRDWLQGVLVSTEDGSTPWDADEAMFGRTVDNIPERQDIRIVWTRVGQEVFAFNPEVGEKTGGRVSDPIIEVITLANSAGVERMNAVTGGLDAALKIPLGNASGAEVYERYRPVLEATSIDDNLKQLVTVEAAAFESLQGYRDARDGLIMRIVALLIVALGLAVQSAALLFEANVRYAIVGRLYGYGFFGRERVPLFVYTVVWLAMLFLAVLFDEVLGWPGAAGAVGSLGLAKIVAAALAIVVADAACCIGALGFVESRQTVSVLKGERE